jgi:hypothetical protein
MGRLESFSCISWCAFILKGRATLYVREELVQESANHSFGCDDRSKFEGQSGTALRSAGCSGKRIGKGVAVIPIVPVKTGEVLLDDDLK